jgi:hypothetical protein
MYEEIKRLGDENYTARQISKMSAPRFYVSIRNAKKIWERYNKNL